MPSVLWGGLGFLCKHPRTFRRLVLGRAWNMLMLEAAANVRNINISEVMGIDTAIVRVSAESYDRALLCALAKLVQPKTFFEIGTYRGETTLAVARNCLDTKIYTLDFPSPESKDMAVLEITDDYLFERWGRGEALRGHPESSRIEQLTGDSATFDFRPYAGKIDMAFVDASHSYSYVKADTEAVLSMLGATGTVVWHDYPGYPGVYAYLNELGKALKGNIYHVRESGITFYSRMSLVKNAD